LLSYETALRYVDILTQKSEHVDYVEEVSSISKTIKEQYGRFQLNPSKNLILQFIQKNFVKLLLKLGVQLMV